MKKQTTLGRRKIQMRANISISQFQRRMLEKYFREHSPCLNTCQMRRKGCHGNCETEKAYLEGFNNYKKELETRSKTEKAIAAVLYSPRKGESI